MELLSVDTGLPVEVPDDQAHEAISSGKYGFPVVGDGSDTSQTVDVPMTKPSGETVYIGAHDVSNAMQQGWRVGTPGQAQASTVQKDLDLPGVAGTYGALRGASFGLSDKAITGVAGLVGGDQTQADVAAGLQGVREARPWESGLSELGGAIAPILLSGGAGAAAEGAEAVSAGAKLAQAGQAARTLNLPSAVAHLGEAARIGVEGALGGAEGASAIGRLGVRAAGLAAQGAAEGVAYGAGNAITESALGNHELTAEKLFASSAEGALLGGIASPVLAGGMAAGGKVLGAAASGARRGIESIAGKITGMDVEKLAAKTFGEAAPGLGKAWEDWVSRSTGADRDALHALNPFTAEGRASAKLALEGDEVKATAAREIRSDVDRLIAATKNITEEAQGGAKIEHIAEIVKKGNEAVTANTSARWFERMHASVDAMLADPGAYGERANLQEAKKTLLSTEKMIVKAVEGGGDVNAQIFAHLDNFKQRLGPWSKPGQFLGADRATSQVLRGEYEGLRTLLESEALWGDAGKAQQAINSKWVAFLDSQSRFNRILTTEGAKDAADAFWTRKQVVDPARVEQFVNGLGRSKNDLVHETIEEHLKNSRALSETISEHFKIPKDTLGDLSDAATAAEAFEKTLGHAKKTVGLVNQLEALDQASKGGAGALMAGLLGSHLGPVGAMAGAVAGAVSRPGDFVRQVAQISKLSDRVDGKIVGGIGGFLKSATARAGSAASKATEGLPMAGTRAAVQAAGRKRSDKAEPVGMEHERQAFAASTKAIGKLASDPKHLQDRVTDMLGTAQIHAPQTSAAYVQQCMRAASFLSSKVPPGGVKIDPLQPRVAGTGPSDAEVVKYNRYVRAVVDPTSVLDDLAQGKLNREGIEAVKAVYPGLYAQIQQEATGRVAETEKRLPYSARVQLGVLLGIPADASLQPGFMQAMQASFGPPPPPAPGPAAPHPGKQLSRSLKLSSGVSTGMQRIQAKG